jgi:hypothetical protein
MSEQLNRAPNTLQQVEAATFAGEEVTRLLATPEIQQGLAASDAAIAEYYRGLETDGKQVKPVLKGVTDQGDCVYVAEYRDDSPPEANPQGNRPDKYVVFAFPLKEVPEADFADNLMPRDVGYVQVMMKGRHVDVAKPGSSFTATAAHVKKAFKSGLKDSDPQAYKEIQRASQEQSSQADKLWVDDPPTFNGQPIRTFEDAAFGSRRQAIVDRVVAPLREKRNEHYEHMVVAFGKDPETIASERAKVDALSKRIGATITIMRANPKAIDQDPNGDLIHDKAKAEYMAHELNNVKAKKAGKVATRAAAAYDADPLGVFEAPAKGKGVLGRWRR